MFYLQSKTTASFSKIYKECPRLGKSMSERAVFDFIQAPVILNFGRNLKPSLFIGGLGDNAVFEVTIWKPSDFRILPRYAYC